MFNLQGSELIIILLLALVVLGPEKLPDAMRKAGQFYAELKKMSSGFQNEFKAVVEEPLNELKGTANTLRDSADFTKLQAGEREEKPKSADMVAAPDPEAVPTDEVPFAPAAGAAAATADSRINESDSFLGEPDNAGVQSDASTGEPHPGDAPQPFSSSQQLSESAPAHGAPAVSDDNAGDGPGDRPGSAGSGDDTVAQPEQSSPAAPKPFPSSDQWGMAVSAPVERSPVAPSEPDPESAADVAEDQPESAGSTETGSREPGDPGDEAGERGE